MAVPFDQAIGLRFVNQSGHSSMPYRKMRLSHLGFQQGKRNFS